jgi:hypothetical protein
MDALFMQHAGGGPERNALRVGAGNHDRFHNGGRDRLLRVPPEDEVGPTPPRMSSVSTTTYVEASGPRVRVVSR